jgi:hypothetical protein
MLMKRSTRLFIAIALTLLLVAVSVNVWAETGRKGTVPVPPRTYPGRCNTPIDFDLGTLLGTGDACRLNVKLVKDPVKSFGPPLTGWSYLLPYAFDVKLVNGEMDSLEICVPLTPDWEDKVVGETINWYRWDEETGEWVTIPTEIKTDSTPPMICGTSDQAGTFSLQGQ